MTQSTGREIIQDALEMLRVFAAGEDARGADIARGLQVLNDTVESLSNESLTCFRILTQTFALQNNQFQYTVGGAGADISGPRPLRVLDAPGSAYLLDQNQNRYMVDVVDELTWNLKTTAVANSNLPDILWYDPQFPLGIINVWPTPTTNYTCSFLSYAQLTEFTTPDTVVDFPPGYRVMYVTETAIALKPYHRNAVLDPDVVQRHSRAKANIKRTNMRTQISMFDPELVSHGNAVYNIYTDRGTGRNT